ncbi:MAG: nitrile hydratase subunit alpha [Chloroflexota bacterium]
MGKNHPNVEPYIVSRVRALESLLMEKDLLGPDTVDRIVSRYENDTGPLIGARAVARAWVDPDYKRLLLTDSQAALAVFGLTNYDVLVVVENTPQVHNLVVCTLCSCYPWPVLGLPPTWYKSPAYRSRAVLEPRALLREFRLEIPAEREVRVWDSSAELRYVVTIRADRYLLDRTGEHPAIVTFRESGFGCAYPFHSEVDLRSPYAV